MKALVDSVRKDKARCSLELTFKGTPLTFDLLQQISDEFGTKNINVESEYVGGYYAGDGDSYLIVHVLDVTKWPEE